MGRDIPAVVRALSARVADFADDLESDLTGADRPGAIPDDWTLRDWLGSMPDLRVDGKAWSLADRAALAPIYDEILVSRVDAAGKLLIIQKSTQVGLTVLSTLAQLFMVSKYSDQSRGVNIASYVPDQAGASFLSSHRWLPIVRSCPDVARRLVASGASAEGSVLTRRLRGVDGGPDSIFRFGWTSGAMMTESFPADIAVLDEVQGMANADIDKVRARMGDSDIRFTLMLSTPVNYGTDINAWYLLGHQAVWCTRCSHCESLSDLSDPAGIFPDKSVIHDGDDYCWACPVCGEVIPPSQMQVGEYVSQNPGADPLIRSFLLPRTISPRITARDAVVGFNRAKDGASKKSFFNRTLARPYINVDEVPATLEHCLACVEEGRKAGVRWERHGEVGGSYTLGCDQIGGWLVLLVLKRMADGRPALVWCEYIYGDDPFRRVSQVMDEFGIAVGVCELLPNFNDAKRWANEPRNRGRAFLAGYSELRDDSMLWGDDPLNRSQRHTAEDERTRYTVILNQYRCMMTALYRIKEHVLLMPDPDELEQEILTPSGRWERVSTLREVFAAFGRTALIVTDDPETRRKKAKVVKLGADPHASFALMLASVAWARLCGTAQWILPAPRTHEAPPQEPWERISVKFPSLPKTVLGLVLDSTPVGSCGACMEWRPGPDSRAGLCAVRQLGVQRGDPGCPMYVSGGG